MDRHSAPHSRRRVVAMLTMVAAGAAPAVHAAREPTGRGAAVRMGDNNNRRQQQQQHQEEEVGLRWSRQRQQQKQYHPDRYATIKPAAVVPARAARHQETTNGELYLNPLTCASPLLPTVSPPLFA